MAAVQDPPIKLSLEERITNVNAKTCPVGVMQQLLCAITGESKWTDREYYRAFAVRSISYLSIKGDRLY